MFDSYFSVALLCCPVRTFLSSFSYFAVFYFVLFCRPLQLVLFVVLFFLFSCSFSLVLFSPFPPTAPTCSYFPCLLFVLFCRPFILFVFLSTFLSSFSCRSWYFSVVFFRTFLSSVCSRFFRPVRISLLIHF